jgi:hypothetical protein
MCTILTILLWPAPFPVSSETVSLHPPTVLSTQGLLKRISCLFFASFPHHAPHCTALSSVSHSLLMPESTVSTRTLFSFHHAVPGSIFLRQAGRFEFEFSIPTHLPIRTGYHKRLRLTFRPTALDFLSWTQVPPKF